VKLGRETRLRATKEFVEYHRKLLGEEYEQFATALEQRGRKICLRVNTIKCTIEAFRVYLLRKNKAFKPLPLCPECFWVEGNEWDTLEHRLGYYYIQSIASILPTIVLNPKPEEKILDLCAAPGSKTTHIAQRMQNKGLIIANDNNFRRIRGLVYNLQRCGVSNTIVTIQDGCRVTFPLRFDRVLVDAPCSNIGTATKNPEVLKIWTLKRVNQLSVVQKKLLQNAFHHLKEKGVLVYSTCTTSIEENESVIEYMLDNFDVRLERITIPGIKLSPGLTEETKACIRIYPHYCHGESYFIAKLRKK